MKRGLRGYGVGGAILAAAGLLLGTAVFSQDKPAQDKPAPDQPAQDSKPAPSGHNHGGIGFGADAAKAAPKPNMPVDAHTYYFPEYDEGVATLAARKAAQLATASTIAAFHDFQFTDRLPESGITFRHQGTDDSGIHYKAVHYDHGNGVVVADVDGDGLPDLYFVTQLGENQLWKNLGHGKFRNITAEAGVGLKDQVSVAASFADVDNDGFPDLFVTTVRHGNHLFLNDGKGHFRDVSKEAGLDYVGHSSGAVFFDFDHDGLLDLLVTNVGRYTTNEKGRGGYYVGLTDAFQGHLHPDRTETSILYKNMGNHVFKDVSKETGLVDGSWSGDAAVADLNGDGWPDVYVLNMQGDNHYYENEGGKRFVDKTEQYFPKTSWGAMGIKFFDYDNDGRPDLIITDMHSDMSQQVGVDQEKKKSDMQWSDADLQGGANNIFGNSLFHNLGGGKFEEVSDAMNVEDYWPWGLSTGDLNADGFQDVFITASMNFPFRYGVNSLLLNDRGKIFRDSEFILGVEPRRDGRTHFKMADVDCDGDEQTNQICKGRKGMVKVMSTYGSRSSAIVDLDNDGDLDIVTNDFNSEPMILISDLAQKKPNLHYLKIKLRGTVSNRDALGATVKVKAGGQTYTQWNDGKSGYLSQSSMPLYFGLGDAAKVDSVEVTWPTGKTQTVTGPKANGLIEVVEEKK
ncbi:MAG TPA: CRTAC1 family protein [Thermoanaerobaculia bacterium]|nr:CRTAC1 family protein [Thermoanaerobaculia bacterium]